MYPEYLRLLLSATALLASTAHALDGNWFCYNYDIIFHNSWDCINQLFWTMRADMVENHVWSPNGYSVTWTWSCNDDDGGITNTYGGYVYAKNSFQDTQNAWDGLEAIITSCEGQPVGDGSLIENAFPGGQYDWGNAHYIEEWWDEQCNSCSKKRATSTREPSIIPMKVTLDAKNRTLVPGETYEHKLRTADGGISTVEKFLVLADGTTKDIM